MDKWAVRYGDAASFVCVGCAGPALAQEFAKSLQLRHCTVGYAGKQPRWGQLGCNGFIVLDENLRVVCSATSAFMEVRELAFAHVEALVDALTAGEKPPRVCPGQMVQLDGLKAHHLNGQHALCISKPNADGRCEVQLRSRKRVSIKVANLSVPNAEVLDGDES
mmetsp:Transcript_58274/g.133732  ORF Transcript_58274/g.133732 Transcript_58274/m.133732 type:complete len:164 (-) Transcript_58274:986-1477(-)